MRNPTKAMDQVTIGLDLGDRTSQFVMLDPDGHVIEEGRIRTTPEGLTRRFESIPPARLAIEVGTHSPWSSRLLKRLGHEVLVANARKLRLIYENDSKNDKVDATYLARVARMDPTLLAPISHRGAAAQADLALLRSRDALVRSRTALVNHVRGAVKSAGARLPRCSTRSFSTKTLQHIPETLRAALEPILQTLESISDKIRHFDRLIDQTASDKYPETARLRQVPGVGVLTALGFVLTLEDPGRFSKSRSVGSYLGLRPRQKDSGSRQPQLRISKAGDSFVRRLLVGSAQYILGPFGPDHDLRRWGLKLASRGGKNAKKRAVVAVARKLAVLLHQLWISGQDYQPHRKANAA